MDHPTLVDRTRLAIQAAFGVFTGRPELAAGALGAVFPSSRGAPPRRGTAELLVAYNEMPWLRAVSDRIAYSMAAVEWRVLGTRSANGRAQRFHRDHRLQRTIGAPARKRLAHQRAKQGTEIVEIEDHPFTQLVENPNPFHVGPAARKIGQVYLDLVGEDFQVIMRNGGGVAAGLPASLWPIPPSWVKETPTFAQPRFLLRPPGASGDLEIPETEMLWAIDPDPSNPYSRGTGYGGTLADELDTSEFASKHVRQFFYNRARPDFVAWVKPGPNEQAMGEAELLRLQQKWQNMHGTFLRAWRPHFTSRELQIHEFQQDFRAQQLDKLRAFERDTIIHVLGIPPEILGILENSNRATIDAADYIFAKYVLTPRLEFRRAVYQERLIGEWDERAIVDYVSPIPADREHALNVTKAHPYAFMLDELRDLADREPLEDGRGQVFAVPINISVTPDPTGLLDAGTAGSEDRGAQELEVPDYEIVEAAVEPRRLPAPIDRAVPDEPSYQLIHRIADRLEPEARRAFLAAVRAAKTAIDFDTLQAAVASGQLNAVLQALHLTEMEAAFPPSLVQVLQRVVDASGQATAREFGGTLGIDLRFDVSNPHAQAWIQRHAAERVVEINESSRQAIRNTILEAFERGGHPHETARWIQRHIGLHNQARQRLANFRVALEEQGIGAAALERRTASFARELLRQRAISIARTETIDASNRGQQLLWEQTARDGQIVAAEWRQDWIVTPDDILDHKVCEPMPFLEANQHVPIGGLFTTGLGRQITGPTAHTRCRCAVRLVKIDPRA